MSTSSLTITPFRAISNTLLNICVVYLLVYNCYRYVYMWNVSQNTQEQSGVSCSSEVCIHMIRTCTYVNIIICTHETNLSIHMVICQSYFELFRQRPINC